MDDESALIAELLRHMPADVRARPFEERRAWLEHAARHVRERRREEAQARAFHHALTHDDRPLHPHLADLARWGLRAPELVEVAPSVFAFELAPESVCDALVEELDHLEAWAEGRGLAITRPNSMNRYGLILDDAGYRGALDAMTRALVQPIAARVYPDVGPLVDHHGFLVEYAPEKDTSLDLHVDDAEVTLNLCLGTEFEGGDLGFAGVRCPDHLSTPAAPDELADVAHRKGWALLHHGRHRHRAHALGAGRRVNLILWCRTSRARRSARVKVRAPTGAAPPRSSRPSRRLSSGSASARPTRAEAARAPRRRAPRSWAGSRSATPPPCPSG